MVTKRAVSDALGLSCVEYYYLSWLSQYYPVEKLFAQSFVPVKKVLNDFSSGSKYELYDGIPRVQDTAEYCGVTDHEFRTLSCEQALKYISAQGYYDLCIVRVNDAFFENSKRRAWREDHYVAVDKKLGWVNEYPLSEGTFTDDEFERVYGGATCCFFLKDLKAEPNDEVTDKIIRQDFGGINADISAEAFESALGILRVTRKRMQRFYKGNIRVAEVLSEENMLLDRLYFAACMKRIKKQQYEKKEIAVCIDRIVQKEKQAAEALK